MLDEARGALFEAYAELKLLAPKSVAERATTIITYFLDYVSDTHEGTSIHNSSNIRLADLMDEAYSAMRADLGIPGEPVTPASNPVTPNDPRIKQQLSVPAQTAGEPDPKGAE